MSEGPAPNPEQATAPPATPATQPAAAPAAAAPAAVSVATAAPAQEGQKTKTRMPYQRACNEKDAKGKLCAGHLKRWYAYGEEIKRKYGANPELYRCEYCHTLYLPAPGYEARTGTLQF